MEIKCKNCGIVWEPTTGINIAAELVECPLCSRDEEEEIQPIDSKKGISQRDKKRVYLSTKAKTEEMLKNSVQRIKPITIKIEDPKQLKKLKKEFKKEKRKRRTKAQMVADQDHVKEKSVLKPRPKLFPEEISDFIKENWADNSDFDLGRIIEKKFNRIYKVDQIKGHRKHNGWISSSPGRKKGQKAIIKPKSERKPLIIKNSKRIVIPEGIDPRIVNFIQKSKQTDPYELKDEIIIKFEKDVSITQVKVLMKQRELPGESVDDEVARIKASRKQVEETTSEVLDDFDEGLNDLELG